MDDDSDDPRQDELGSLQAIFPEIQPDDRRPYCFTIELPVHPAKPVTVTFPAAANAEDAAAAQLLPGAEPRVDSHELSHLPAVVVRIDLPEGYPSEKPPNVSISTSPPWLTRDVTKKLEGDGQRLWEEMGRDMVVFTYIDHIQQASDDVFGMVDGNGTLEIDPSHKIAILDYDIEATRASFEKETFDCGICLGTGILRLTADGCRRLTANLPRRSQERFRVPQNARLRTHILYPMLAGILRQCHYGGGPGNRPLPCSELLQRARRGRAELGQGQETQGQNVHQPQ